MLLEIVLSGLQMRAAPTSRLVVRVVERSRLDERKRERNYMLFDR